MVFFHVYFNVISVGSFFPAFDLLFLRYNLKQLPSHNIFTDDMESACVCAYMPELINGNEIELHFISSAILRLVSTVFLRVIPLRFHLLPTLDLKYSQYEN